MKKKNIIALLFLTALFALECIVLEDKISINRRLSLVRSYIRQNDVEKARFILNSIKNENYDSEFASISNYYLALIEFEKNNYYQSLYYAESAYKNPFFDLLIDYYKSEIRYLLGLSYYKSGMYDDFIAVFSDAPDFFIDSVEKKSRIYLILSDILVRQKNEKNKALFYYSQIDKSKLTKEDLDLYVYLEDIVLWDKIDISQVGYKDPNVSAILVDKDNIFIGTWNGGLIQYNYILEKYSHYAGDSLSSSNIRYLYNDGRYIYIGTDDGLNYYDKRDGRFRFFEETKGASISSIASDEDNLYIGTLGQGLVVYNKKDKKFYGNSKELLNNVAYLYVFDDTLAISTYSGALYYYNDGNISRVDSFKINSPITSINKIGDNIWYSSFGGGIAVYSLKEKKYVYFSTKNGRIKDDYILCSGYYSGKIYFGTLGAGVYIYDIELKKWDLFEISNYYYGVNIKNIVFGDKVMFIGTLGEGVLKKIILDN
ncbi:MAG TPA: hypothetical protein PLG34_06385 [Spirochaetota bacterium]|jgi:hypothetical protein|nr:MAG: hypothetical protein BWX91_01907 [Spirochaetes bacterium ADurb.Bin133]HNZ26588.1 hypothetical protein [Spirochaetota bacterium]HPY87591.1 hypothetical protein [Spirochaetota bacterium]